MIINNKYNPHIETYNKYFNDSTKPFIDNVFVAEHEGKGGNPGIGYVNSEISQGEGPYFTSHPNVKPVNQIVRSPKLNDFMTKELEQLGEYERIVVSNVFWGQYSTYVLGGELGSGKTATVKHILGFLKRCEETHDDLDILSVYINFNIGTHYSRDKSFKELSKSFRSEMFGQLAVELEKNLKKFQIKIDSFREYYVTRYLEKFNHNLSKYYLFRSFENMVINDSGWIDKTESQRRADFIRYIDHLEGDDNKVTAALLVIGFIVRKFPYRIKALFVFDNIDIIVPEYQYMFLDELLRTIEVVKIKTLIPLRKSTFSTIDNQRAYTFGYIKHFGPDSQTVIINRLNECLNRWEESCLESGLSNDEILAGIKRRIIYILKVKNKSLSPLKRVLLLGGGSIRRTLIMCRRLFRNNVVMWDQDPQNYSELIQASILGTELGFLSVKDQCVANLFANPVSNYFSLINLRIIQLVFSYSVQKKEINASNIISYLRSASDWDDNDILSSINYLLDLNRPLLWADGLSYFESFREFANSNKILHLTRAGENYLTSLSKDLVYMQECLSSISWNSVEMNYQVDYSNIFDRFKYHRKALGQIYKEDLEQIIKFEMWLEGKELSNTISPELFSLRIICAISDQVFNILKSISHAKHEVNQELTGWASLLIQVINSDESLNHRFVFHHGIYMQKKCNEIVNKYGKAGYLNS